MIEIKILASLSVSPMGQWESCEGGDKREM